MSLVGTRPPTVDEWELYEPHHSPFHAGLSEKAKDKNTRIFYKICVKCLLYLCVIFGKII